MNRLWLISAKYCKNKRTKRNLFWILNILYFNLIGLIFACIYCGFIHHLSWTAIICFTGYFGYFCGFLGGALFIANHE